MEYIGKILDGSFRLYADRCGNFGLNTGNTNSSYPWYNLGNWESFKHEVDRALANERSVALAFFSLEDLEAEVAERRKLQSSV